MNACINCCVSDGVHDGVCNVECDVVLDVVCDFVICDLYEVVGDVVFVAVGEVMCCGVCMME